MDVYLGGFPAFAGYFALSLVLTALFAAVYSLVTAHSEFNLLRSGNNAAAPAFLGAIIGFVLPMKAAMAGSANVLDFVLWAVIAAVAQVAGYFVARIAMPDVSKRIEAGEVHAGVWLGGVSIAVGLLNSAAMTY